jgi:hypothetical protein
MPALKFGKFAPDISSYKNSTSQIITNVIARADGYGPFNDLLAFTQMLPGPCRGYFYGRQPDGTVQIFAGTATDLYLLDNSSFSWTKVSVAGSYSSLSSDSNWQFAQFGSIVFATQQNVVLQSYNMSSSTLFANQAGSPPQASYITVVGQFLVLSGLLSNKFRLQWSGIGDPTNWVAGVNQSDFQDFPDGGIVRGVAGGEYGTVFQDTCIRSMVYQPGSPVIFQITKVADDMGLFAPYGIVRAGDSIYIPSTKGFQVLAPGALPSPIGKEQVDRTFFANIDQSNMQLCIGFADPASTRVGWAFKSINGGTTGLFDTILIYDPLIGQNGSWTQITSILGEYISSLSKPGITLEGLDAIAPGALAITGAANNGTGLIRIAVPATATLTTGQIVGITTMVGTTEANGNWMITVIDGTHFDLTKNFNTGAPSAFVNAYVSGGIVGGSIDAMTQSLDSFPASTLVALSAFTQAGALGFFNGPALQATLDTAEQGGDFNRISMKKGMRPDTDAPVVFGSVGMRENLQSAVVYSAETLVNAQGVCPTRISTRYGRMRLRIPYGTVWTFATAVEPMIGQEGAR